MEQNNSIKHTKPKITVLDIAAIGLMAAVIFIATFFRIQIPTALGKTMIHFGNIFCLLAGLMLGNMRGGLAAGMGSMIFDLTDPLFISSAPWTFLFKFAMAYTAGTIAYSGGAEGDRLRRNIVAVTCGAVLYTTLYVGKNFIFDYFLLRNPLETVLIANAQRGIVSIFNAIVAAVVSVMFAPAFRNAMKRSGIYAKLHPVAR